MVDAERPKKATYAKTVGAIPCGFPEGGYPQGASLQYYKKGNV